MLPIITTDDCQHLGSLLWECCLEPNIGSSLSTSVSPFFLLTLPIELDYIHRLVSCWCNVLKRHQWGRIEADLQT